MLVLVIGPTGAEKDALLGAVVSQAHGLAADDIARDVVVVRMYPVRLSIFRYG